MSCELYGLYYYTGKFVLCWLLGVDSLLVFLDARIWGVGVRKLYSKLAWPTAL